MVGCTAHKPVVIGIDLLVREAQDYVMALSEKMPLWDDDVKLAQYEKVELAVVKADIEVAKRANSEIEFLKDVAKLRKDWDTLYALDDLLRHVSLA